jgi:predicted RNase H-related nuclease YkuK (DUF458 family)
MTTRVLRKLNVAEVVNFILDCSPETNVYVGSDSERFRLDGQWHADYMIAVVVHIDGCHGCKVFGEVVREPDYDQRKDRPALRLMNEVVKVADAFSNIRKGMELEVDRRMQTLMDQFDTGVITDREYSIQCDMLVQKLDKQMEIHLDINPDKAHGSSCVLQEAIGYIRGTCNVVPLIKPNAFAASFAADRGIGLLNQNA